MKVLTCEDWQITGTAFRDIDCLNLSGVQVTPTIMDLPTAGGFLPSITATEGATISSLIIGLWAVAWAASQVIKVLKPNANN